MIYNLSHLTQDENQRVSGPVQDDEALFLFALIRGCRIRRVLEIGGLAGYSARNFCAAVGNTGIVYTCECNPIKTVATNHRVLSMCAKDLRPLHVDNLPLDLIFFDAHVPEEFGLLDVMQSLITEETIIALHDTNLVYRDPESGNPLPGPWRHQPVECDLVNHLHDAGYDSFSIRTQASDHSKEFPIRMGLTVMQRFRKL